VWVAIALTLAVLAWLVQIYLDRSRRGYQLVAVREDEDAALSLGVPARWLKVAAICVSAALTAVCGALWAQYIGFVDPFYVFSVDLSVRFALAAIIGGLGTALGPFLGAALVTTVETFCAPTSRHRRGAGGDLPDRLRLRADGHGAVGTAGARGVDRRPPAPASRRGDGAMSWLSATAGIAP
jgi:branched-chain amino acid transport system permease protein